MTGRVLHPSGCRRAAISHNSSTERHRNMLVHDTVTKKAHIQTAIPGPKSKAIYDAEQRYISPGIQTIASLSQLAMEKGEGCVVEDVDGNRYIDFLAGVAVASLGYNHPRYVRAIQDQVARIHVG